MGRASRGMLARRGHFEIGMADLDRIAAAMATNGLWLAAADAERVTGWTLKSEGMCRDDQCVPLPATAAGGGRVDVAAFWRRLGNPVLCDDDRETWMLGAGADDRNAALAGLMAPDFTLPDLSGRPHTLSHLRGNKVLLVTWASW